ncbi:CDP-alcohol phosphatidyltransferase family protein [bacterium]|nr:CDP-alcohol phosphatidyltransferase family protein [bacterium]MBU1882014.1 CDP-alcohol phosphatidyltransferase family protein [bacterium]
MAVRLPEWVIPDHLTGLGLAATLIIGAAYWLTNFNSNWLWVVNAGLVLHWWADSLDGTLARVRHIERERYGLFVDHFSDAISTFVICFAMGLSNFMEMNLALLLIIAYFSMTILVYLVTIARGVFKISFVGFGPTEVRLAIIISNIIVWWFNNPTFNILGKRFTLFSLLALGAALVLFSLFLSFGVIEGRKLYKLDPPKFRQPTKSGDQ